MIIGKPINTKDFSYFKDTKVFVSEISSIINSKRLFGQLYNDACDIGFVLVSEKTGKSQAYYLKEEKRFDGDYQSWTFLPAVPVLPALKDSKVIVYND